MESNSESKKETDRVQKVYRQACVPLQGSRYSKCRKIQVMGINRRMIKRQSAEALSTVVWWLECHV